MSAKSWSQVAQNAPGSSASSGRAGSGSMGRNSILDDAPALPTATTAAPAKAKRVVPGPAPAATPTPANAWTGTLSSDATAALDKMTAAPALAPEPVSVVSDAPRQRSEHRPVASPVNKPPTDGAVVEAPAPAVRGGRGGRDGGGAVRGGRRQPPAFEASASGPAPSYLPRLKIVDGRDPATDILSVEPPRATLLEAEVVSISKKLSHMLRHGAVAEGLPMTVNGYVALTSLLGHPRFRQVTRSSIAKVTNENAKQRFHLAYGVDGEIYIRANQGHSLPGLEVDMHRITNPDEIPVAFHGTKMKVWPLIAATGLNRMGRQHIHMATDVPGSREVISGARASSDCVVAVDIGAMVRDGIEVLVSANGVVLSEGVNGVIVPKYFARVFNKAGQELWDRATQRATLPLAEADAVTA